jgi:hypothetical protein
MKSRASTSPYRSVLNLSKSFTILLSCLIFSVAICANTLAQSNDNPIQAENRKMGNTNWIIDNANAATNHEIEGYASLTSVNRGGDIKFFVSGSDVGGTKTYNVDIYRMGFYDTAGARLVNSLGPFPLLHQQSPDQPDQYGMIECNWSSQVTITTSSSVPDDWRSGVYLAKLTVVESNKQSYIVFIVREDGRHSDYLYQASVTTWQAYNNWGEKSLYGFNSTNGQARKVSFNRPYAGSPRANAGSGIGAGELLTNYQLQTYPISSASWEYNMIRFLEKEGRDVTYSTNVDTHTSRDELMIHKAFLSVGHDEYWSWEMRRNVEYARDHGINLGFFSSNVCYWQIRFENSTLNSLTQAEKANRTIVAYKENVNEDPLKDPQNWEFATYTWAPDAPNYGAIGRPGDPEQKLVGVMYIADRIDWHVVINNHNHWICQGGPNACTEGQVLTGLLGYEVDVRQNDKYEDSPVTDENVIAKSPYDGAAYSEMTVYTAPTSGAIVFATGTMQWSWGLDDYNVSNGLRTTRLNETAKLMTLNVLDKFIQTSNPPTTPAMPTNLMATAVSSSQINLTWNDNSNNEDGFKIEESTDGSTFTPLTTTTTNAYQHTPLPANTTRHYRVRAYNAAGDSAPSNVDDATTFDTGGQTKRGVVFNGSNQYLVSAAFLSQSPWTNITDERWELQIRGLRTNYSGGNQFIFFTDKASLKVKPNSTILEFYDGISDDLVQLNVSSLGSDMIVRVQRDVTGGHLQLEAWTLTGSGHLSAQTNNNSLSAGSFTGYIGVGADNTNYANAQVKIDYLRLYSNVVQYDMGTNPPTDSGTGNLLSYEFEDSGDDSSGNGRNLDSTNAPSYEDTP